MATNKVLNVDALADVSTLDDCVLVLLGAAGSLFVGNNAASWTGRSDESDHRLDKCLAHVAITAN